MSAPLRILHCQSTFSPGGKELRTVKLMNAFGKALNHRIVSGQPEETGARALIDRKVKATFPTDFPSLKGSPTPGRLITIAKALAGYDLILTYNWGAMDVVMAHTVFAQNLGLPPLIHHEDGFNEDEAVQLKSSRNWYRRIALWRTQRLVVPSRVLERIALDTWKQPRERVRRIDNGIDVAAFANKPNPNALRVVKRDGERWVGTLAGLRAVKQLPMLVQAMTHLPDNWHLVILGDGPEKEAILEAARQAEIAHRVHLPGAIKDPANVIGLFDIFALSSKSEQFPISVVEAMAAGLPVAAPNVGDIATMVSSSNAPFIARPNTAETLGQSLKELAQNPELRAKIGAENRSKAAAHYNEATMIEAYRSLYSDVMGKPF
ncbi:glycosyltransferase family 4 protein [Erythrobacter sp. YT30]|uniref:glycosyltransferase family 4 protein n=1 Tax=Erythrobacter sp. YT30 TaxID=1735012 RepID=UPI00076BEF59|nr:glycosyltransferase family 4 protein [Erythrobacter sp. YT30]KWV90591.1 glycosyl transferase family 1 [Erythrobacter sp. YT30]